MAIPFLLENSLLLGENRQVLKHSIILKNNKSTYQQLSVN